MTKAVGKAVWWVERWVAWTVAATVAMTVERSAPYSVVLTDKQKVDWMELPRVGKSAWRLAAAMAVTMVG